MRGYVEERLGPEHLPELLAVLQRPEELLGLIVQAPFVVKATHGSQMLAMVKQDSPDARQTVVNSGRRWLKDHYWRRHGEWGYRYIPRRLVVERYLGTAADEPPPDWKWYCIGGKAVLVSYDYNRFVRHHRGFYDPEGNQLDLGWTIASSLVRPTRRHPHFQRCA